MSESVKYITSGRLEGRRSGRVKKWRRVGEAWEGGEGKSKRDEERREEE